MKPYLIYLLTIPAVFYVFDQVFPTSKFWIQLCGAFLVNVLFYDLTNSKLLVRYTAPLRLICEYKIRRYLREPSSSPTSENELRRFLLRWLIPRQGITRHFLRTLKPDTAAGLLIALQKQQPESSSNVNFVDFKDIARLAVQSTDYRAHLLRRAVASFPNTRESINQLAHAEDAPTGDDLRSISDQQFYQRLERSKSEIVHAFSTTSQLSKDFVEALTLHATRIAEFHFYIVSPLILSDTALLRLGAEYENPRFTIKSDQMVCDSDGRPLPNFDMPRRSLRILDSLRALLSQNLPFPIFVHLFIEAYPGVKVKLMERDRFAQFQPGSLTYQNNLYRFGVAIDGGALFTNLLTDLELLRSEQKFVRTAALDDAFLTGLGDLASREIAQWLLSRGVNHTDLAAREKHIARIAGSPYPSPFLASVREALFMATEAIAHRGELALMNDSAGGVIHLSVGAIIRVDERFLLIRKKDPFYERRYSIVAGHVNVSESPLQAINREVREELGVTATGAHLSDQVLDIADSCRYGAHRHVWFVFECMLETYTFNPSSAEIEEVLWIPQNELSKYFDQMTGAARAVLERHIDK